MPNLLELRNELRSLANPEKAIILQRFFKTGKGQYGEGDVFLGITVPQSRTIAKKYLSLSPEEIKQLLQSKIHEERLIALLILVENFRKSKKDRSKQRRIYEFYLSNTSGINNWDLVDLSAEKIVGEFLLQDEKSILKQLALSSNIWERRIAMIATFAFIKKRRFGESLALAEMLMEDEHDLMHKAVGWMLREIGKRDQRVLEIFLQQRYKSMPRTMLRYSIEKFPEEKRQKYLKGLV